MANLDCPTDWTVRYPECGKVHMGVPVRNIIEGTGEISTLSADGTVP